MPGSSSWMPYAPQGVKGFDDDDDTDKTVIVLIHRYLVPDLALSVILSKLSWIAHKLILASLTLWHMSVIHSCFSSQLITSIFTQIALCEVDLHFLLILVKKANAVEEGTTRATWLFHQCNESIHVTDGMKVTSLAASHQYKTSAVTDRLWQIALNWKLVLLIRKVV